MAQFIKDGASGKKSQLIKATKGFTKLLDDYEILPQKEGVFGSKAKIISGGVTINSDTLDFDFDVSFDDDMEANECSITVYNLSDNTINNLKRKQAISIEAGFDKDTGVIFKGFIDKVQTKHEGSDKVTTIRCYDDISNKSITELTFAKGTSASYILKNLINRTGTPIAVFKVRRDHVYKDEEKVDGSLTENIRKYSEVCGVSTYVVNGKIYCRHLKTGDDISFTVSENTGMIGSPSPYEEELTAEDFKETIKGYEIEMIMQHRMRAGAICNVQSLVTKGKYRVRSGEHHFAYNGECTTRIKVM